MATMTRVKNMIKNAFDSLMSNALPRIHNYDKVAFMLHDMIISDMDDIQITYDQGGTTKSFGAMGDVGYNMSMVMSGAITIKMPTMSRYRKTLQTMIDYDNPMIFDIKIINTNRGCDDIVFYGCRWGQRQNDTYGDFVPYTTFQIFFADVRVLKLFNQEKEGDEWYNGW